VSNLWLRTSYRPASRFFRRCVSLARPFRPPPSSACPSGRHSGAFPPGTSLRLVAAPLARLRWCGCFPPSVFVPSSSRSPHCLASLVQRVGFPFTPPSSAPLPLFAGISFCPPGSRAPPPPLAAFPPLGLAVLSFALSPPRPSGPRCICLSVARPLTMVLRLCGGLASLRRVFFRRWASLWPPCSSSNSVLPAPIGRLLRLDRVRLRLPAICAGPPRPVRHFAPLPSYVFALSRTLPPLLCSRAPSPLLLHRNLCPWLPAPPAAIFFFPLLPSAVTLPLHAPARPSVYF